MALYIHMSTGLVTRKDGLEDTNDENEGISEVVSLWDPDCCWEPCDRLRLSGSLTLRQA